MQFVAKQFYRALIKKKKRTHGRHVYGPRMSSALKGAVLVSPNVELMQAKLKTE